MRSTPHSLIPPAPNREIRYQRSGIAFRVLGHSGTGRSKRDLDGSSRISTRRGGTLTSTANSCRGFMAWFITISLTRSSYVSPVRAEQAKRWREVLQIYTSHFSYSMQLGASFSPVRKANKPFHRQVSPFSADHRDSRFFLDRPPRSKTAPRKRALKRRIAPVQLSTPSMRLFPEKVR